MASLSFAGVTGQMQKKHLDTNQGETLNHEVI